MEYAALRNGVKIPMLGYRVFQNPEKDTKRCVLDVVSVGYRSIDTAQGYFNEEAVGEAIDDCGVPHEELLLTTKIWISNGRYEKAAEKIYKLMLIHQPFNDYCGAYREMD